VDLGEPGGGQSVAAVIFRELSAVLVPGAPQMLRHARVVGVGRESDSRLGTLSLPSSPVQSISFNSALQTYSWRSGRVHGNLACLFPSLIPKLLHSVSALPNAINLGNIANWNTFLQLQALVTVVAFSVSSHSFHKHLLSAGAQCVQAPC